jgi:thymidine kinase
MSKLFFRYGAMNSGKSTALLQVAHNYEERGQSVVVVKPELDTKGHHQIVSRLGVNRTADILLAAGQDLRGKVKELRKIRASSDSALACVLIDEAQFLEPAQVDAALEIAVLDDLPVVAFGIRTDFRRRAFPGSLRLLEVAHSLEEMKTICRCGEKAIFNARLGESGMTHEGHQIMIDAPGVTYEALCAHCYLDYEQRDSLPL